MSWETRKDKSYYYRKRRVDGHVISEYLGRAENAARAATEDTRVHDNRTQEQARVQELDELIRQYDQFAQSVQMLVDAHLLLNGYHKHRGQWRKIRNLRRKKSQ